MRYKLFLIACSVALAGDAFEVKVTGHGQPMILIPSPASSGETWDSTVARLFIMYDDPQWFFEQIDPFLSGK